MKAKICTSVKQSKKLIELGIDVKTADMYYMYRHWEIDEETVGSQSDASIGFNSDFYCGADNGKTYHYIPAWSLTALLELIPDEIQDNHFLTLEKEKGEYCCCFEDINGNSSNHFFGNSAIDAVLEMIYQLLKNKLIK